MNAAEWMRAVTHRSEQDTVAVEAAAALQSFAREPAHLVVACRQILAHHPSVGALWWCCSTVLTAADPASAARDAGRALSSDPTAARLAGGLPAPSGDRVVAVVGWPSIVDRALGDRPDIAPIAVRLPDGDTDARVRRRATDATVRTIVADELELADVDLVLTGVIAASPDRLLLPAGAGAVLDHVSARTKLWIVTGVGEMLPRPMVDAIATCLERAGLPSSEIDLARVDRVAGPRGVERTDVARSHASAPVAVELLGRSVTPRPR